MQVDDEFNEAVVCMYWRQPTDSDDPLLGDDSENSGDSKFQETVCEITPALVEGARHGFVAACEQAAVSL